MIKYNINIGSKQCKNARIKKYVRKDTRKPKISAQDPFNFDADPAPDP